MNIVSMKQAIEEITQDKMIITSDLNAQRRRIIDAVKPFIKTELHNTVENEIKEFPEHTMQLGMDRLKRMKEAMMYVIYNSNDITEAVYSNDLYWVHTDYHVNLNKDSYEQKYKNKRAAKEKIISGLKVLMGVAGKILIDYEYESLGQSCGLTSKWQLNAQGEIVLGANCSFRIPRDLDDKIVEYIALLDQFHDITYKLTTLTSELNVQEAMRLWKEA